MPTFSYCMIAKKSTDEIIRTYKQLIRSMPRQNQYLLLYVLDLLSVFARKSDKNLMTATSTSSSFFAFCIRQFSISESFIISWKLKMTKFD